MNDDDDENGVFANFSRIFASWRICGKMAVVLGQSAPPAIETGSKIKVRCASVRLPCDRPR